MIDKKKKTRNLPNLLPKFVDLDLSLRVIFAPCAKMIPQINWGLFGHDKLGVIYPWLPWQFPQILNRKKNNKILTYKKTKTKKKKKIKNKFWQAHAIYYIIWCMVHYGGAFEGRQTKIIFLHLWKAMTVIYKYWRNINNNNYESCKW